MQFRVAAAAICSSAGFLLSPGTVCAQGSAKTPATAPAEVAHLTLDLTRPGASVSPTLYGFMTEEINHSYDGGIYAELIQNRTFKDDAALPVH